MLPAGAAALADVAARQSRQSRHREVPRLSGSTRACEILCKACAASDASSLLGLSWAPWRCAARGTANGAGRAGTTAVTVLSAMRSPGCRLCYCPPRPPGGQGTPVPLQGAGCPWAGRCCRSAWRVSGVGVSPARGRAAVGELFPAARVGSVPSGTAGLGWRSLPAQDPAIAGAVVQLSGPE